MKLGSYISIAINTLFWFIVCWILMVFSKNNSVEIARVVISLVIGCIMILAFSIITINILTISLKRFIGSIILIKQGTISKKLLTLIFYITMLVFATFICIFWFIWIFQMVKNGFFPSYGEGILIAFANCSVKYISGANGDFVFIIYVTAFVFIIIWSILGIIFEILKKFLNKIKN